MSEDMTYALWKENAPTTAMLDKVRDEENAALKEQVAMLRDADVLHRYLNALRSIPKIGLSERQFGELKTAAEALATTEPKGKLG